MLKLIKNITLSDVVINDMGITILSNSIYNLKDKSYESSDNLLEYISNGSLVFIKSESPEILYSRFDSLRYLILNNTVIPKVSSSGENIVLSEYHGHLPNNNIVNWTFNEYLSNDAKYFETMYIPLDKTLIINSFNIGSNNVIVNAKIELFQWNIDFNDYIRINPDIRLDEYYITKLTGALSNDTLSITVDDASLLKPGMIYQIETINNIPLYRKIDFINNNEVTFNLNLNSSNIKTNAKIALVDRVLCENNSYLSNNIIKWQTPLRISGASNIKLIVTIKNTDISEPGVINGSINGWIGTL